MAKIVNLCHIWLCSLVNNVPEQKIPVREPCNRLIPEHDHQRSERHKVDNRPRPWPTDEIDTLFD